MGALLDFLLEDSVEDLREKVVISHRLREHPFEIKAVTAGEMADYIKRCRRGREVDSAGFDLLLILNHCLEPDFRSAEALEKARCATPEELVNKTLRAGEIKALARAIYRLSGYEQGMAEMRDEVKNS
ncbi:MAG: hypothetical protein Q4C00_00570 [Bacillota bacterium]|nr:hypothetical protein [Bacillota bacterium]